MHACKVDPCPLAVVAALLLTREIAVGLLDLARIAREEQGRLYLCAVTGKKVCFQAEVKACGLFQFGEVSHEPILARILAEPLIIPLVKGNEMIIHTCKGVYISVEILVAITPTIQLVFIGQIHGQPPKK